MHRWSTSAAMRLLAAAVCFTARGVQGISKFTLNPFFFPSSFFFLLFFPPLFFCGRLMVLSLNAQTRRPVLVR